VGALAAIALMPGRRATPARPAAPAPPSPPPAPSPAAAAKVAPWWRRTFDVLRTATRRALKGNVTNVAAALAYYAFLAIPAVLLVAVGVFGLVAGDGAINSIVDRLDGLVPDDALTLIEDTLTRVTRNGGSGAGLAIIGLLLAIWTSSSAMSALMRGLNSIHGRAETRSFARQRVTAVALLAWALVALVVSFGLLVLGAPLSSSIGEAVGAETTVAWIWWAAQWPILGAALYLAVAGILRAGPSGRPGSRGAVLAGAATTVAIWVVASALFAVYVSRFGNYGAAWGSLSAVIVMLTWLWLSGLAVLLGAQVEDEMDRRRGA
jgi:membrane protein